MEGRVIAITGGASGIGLATAKLLASKGAKLSIADVSEENLEAAKKSIQSEHVSITKCDVRDLSQVQDWIKRTVDTYGRLDGACNLAGTIGFGDGKFDIGDEDEENWDLIIGVNLTGVMHSIKCESKYMEAGASIVNAASVAGLQGGSHMAAYCASKHGVIGLTRSAARDFGARGIRVNAIAPGFIVTPMTMGRPSNILGPAIQEACRERSCLGRDGQPEDVAKLIVFLLSDESSFITGMVHEIDGGYSA